jgi:hypothetical protein
MDEPIDDHRRVPLEVLREFARSCAETASTRSVAEDAGVGRSTVHKFINAGTMPHPRVRRRLALWYLRRVRGIDHMELLRPYTAALSVLLADFEEPALGQMRADVLNIIRRGYVDEGLPEPRWMEAVRERQRERLL